MNDQKWLNNLISLCSIRLEVWATFTSPCCLTSTSRSPETTECYWRVQASPSGRFRNLYLEFSPHHCLKLNSSIRGLFIIDPSGMVKHMSVNDLPVGRCVEETLRLVKAFQFVETHGEVCPASWTPESPTVSLYIVEIEALPGWLLIKHALNIWSV